jgi:RND family efflux transporter MFP subunit
MAGEDLRQLKIDKSVLSARAARRKGPLRIVLILLVLSAAILLAWIFFFRPVPVEVVTVSQIYPSQDLALLNASGYVVAQRRAAVAAKMTGRLEWVGVEEGSRVRKGEVIARLENEDLKAAVVQAEAEVARARATLEQALAELEDARISFERLQDLLAARFVSQAEVDAASARLRRARGASAAGQSGVQVAEAALKGARINLDYTLVRAPFDAVVLTKNADIGDIVTPIGAAAEARAAVVNIADMNSLLVEADVSEASLGLVTVGQACEIQLDAFPEARFRGEVHMVVPTADRARATVLVKIRFLEQDPRILPEMSARVSFLQRPITPEEQQPRTAVHADAVDSSNGRSVVFQIRAERAMEMPVVIGERFGDLLEILQGAEVGDTVVLRPLPRITDGTRIRVIQ